LTDVVILFALGALGGLGAMFSLNKPLRVRHVLEAVLKNGSWGAGVGVMFIGKVGKGFVAGLAILVGAGMVSRNEIRAFIARTMGFDVRDSNNKTEPTDKTKP
jgi:hypothetical protein